MAYYNRGFIKSELGQKQVAIADFDRVIAIDANNVNAYYRRGNIKLELGDKSGAIADLTKAAELARDRQRMNDYQQIVRSIQKIRG